MSLSEENSDIDEANELSSGLESVFDDMNERLKEKIQAMLVELLNFSRVTNLYKKKPSLATPSIASALHMFGMEGW